MTQIDTNYPLHSSNIVLSSNTLVIGKDFLFPFQYNDLKFFHQTYTAFQIL